MPSYNSIGCFRDNPKKSLVDKNLGRLSLLDCENTAKSKGKLFYGFSKPKLNDNGEIIGDCLVNDEGPEDVKLEHAIKLGNADEKDCYKFTTIYKISEFKKSTLTDGNNTLLLTDGNNTLLDTKPIINYTNQDNIIHEVGGSFVNAIYTLQVPRQLTTLTPLTPIVEDNKIYDYVKDSIDNKYNYKGCYSYDSQNVNIYMIYNNKNINECANIATSNNNNNFIYANNGGDISCYKVDKINLNKLKSSNNCIIHKNNYIGDKGDLAVYTNGL